MKTRGEYKVKEEKYSVLMCSDRTETQVVLAEKGQVCSAFKKNNLGNYCYLNKSAMELNSIVSKAVKGCTPKNATAAPFVKGTMSQHQFTKSKVQYVVSKFNGEVVYFEATGEDLYVWLEYQDESIDLIPSGIPYVKLSSAHHTETASNDVNANVVVRNLEEIAILTGKDLSWLNTRKYFIVNDDAVAEQILSTLDNWTGVISYDTETSGLKINMFGKVNSEYSRQLIKYNDEHPDAQMKVDRLVGVIFCVEPNVSYYFPLGHRKFKNLYEDINSPTRTEVISRIRNAKQLKDPQCLTDMGKLFRDTTDDKLTPDVILMERCRKILETGHILAHHGTFEWKVGQMYDIDTNLRDDTMLLHQVMYKFRTTTSNRGEPSNLKYLSKVELNVDQLDLEDFFPDFKEDESGLAVGKGKGKSKKENSNIDFSYMDYEGTLAYAPADGDLTLQILYKYKVDLLQNHPEMEYIYSVEVLVACAIAYSEFYGHRIDEKKIEETREQFSAKLLDLEKQIKDLADLKEGEELNLASPGQVAELFYDKLGVEMLGDKRTVAKKAIEPLTKMLNEDGELKYPAVALYADYKKTSTLLTKFFDNLQYFMYPGGFIFSSFGQIATATGRMSCKKPNAQQYPEAVTAIVVPRDNCIMGDADYSQIEYRVLVGLALETKLAEMFEEPDVDYHTLMASLMFGVPYASVTPKMRKDAKSFNFGIPYGMGFKSLAILLSGMSDPVHVAEAKEKYELYFKDQPKVRQFFNNIKEQASVNKFTKTYWKRYRYYSFTDKDGNESQSRKAMALRQAGNAVIQGTAADIFKISVARVFTLIRQKNLFQKVYITNLIHDEQLFEFNTSALNIQRTLKEVTDCMQFKVAGLPSLYVGAGLGKSWKEAKGKMAEIHPYLLTILNKEVENTPIELPADAVVPEPNAWVEYMDNRIYHFRLNKIKEYLEDHANYDCDLHPAIGSLLNLQFNYGHTKKSDNLDDAGLTLLCMKLFIENNNIDSDYTRFCTSNIFKVAEEDKEYDEEDEDDEEEEDGYLDSEFSLLDESDKLYGTSIQDYIRTYGYIISKELKVCGVNTLTVGLRRIEEIADFLVKKVCEPTDKDAMQIVYLKENNVLFYTGIYVKDINGCDITKRIKTQQILDRQRV